MQLAEYFCLSLCLLLLKIESANSNLPAGFVYLRDVDPTIIEEIRYAGYHNFIGRPITGYLAPRCILTEEAAVALARVQGSLKQKSKTLKVYDCYRPKRSVLDFLNWSTIVGDEKMKVEFYPRTPKSKLFDDGYISRDSRHCRGSTVDLTIVPLPIPPQAEYHDGEPLKSGILPKGERFDDNSVEMGTGYDVLDVLAWTADPTVSVEARANRAILNSTMDEQGFENYAKESWHFTLRNEPFANASMFDFEITDGGISRVSPSSITLIFLVFLAMSIVSLRGV